jgi:hypothetical protein
MTEMVRQELAEKGWVVLDHKPRHIIVRPVQGGTGLLSRQGKPVWALIDYELLFPM